MTRLETRTKECNACASIRECILACEMKVKAGFILLRCHTASAVSVSPGLFFSDRFEVEHSRYDPKDGELYLRRVKPGETLVEARCGTDVQIVRSTWV